MLENMAGMSVSLVVTELAASSRGVLRSSLHLNHNSVREPTPTLFRKSLPHMLQCAEVPFQETCIPASGLI